MTFTCDYPDHEPAAHVARDVRVRMPHADPRANYVAFALTPEELHRISPADRAAVTGQAHSHQVAEVGGDPVHRAKRGMR